MEIFVENVTNLEKKNGARKFEQTLAISRNYIIIE